MTRIMLTWFPCDSRSHGIFQIQSKAKQRWEVSPNWRLRKGAGEVPPRQKGPCPHPSSPSTQPGLLPLIKQDLGLCSLMLPCQGHQGYCVCRPFSAQSTPQPAPTRSSNSPPPSTQPSGPSRKIYQRSSIVGLSSVEPEGRNKEETGERNSDNKREKEGTNLSRASSYQRHAVVPFMPHFTNKEAHIWRDEVAFKITQPICARAKRLAQRSLAPNFTSYTSFLKSQKWIHF